MSNKDQTASGACTFLKARRRRRRRNFRYYRETSIIELQTILRENLSGLPGLYDHFFPPEGTAAGGSLPTSDGHDGEPDEPDEPQSPSDLADAGVIPLNCPVRTPDEALVAIHGAFYFHVRSKINLGKKIFKIEQAKVILAGQCLHYSRACRVSLVNYSMQDDHFHMLIAVAGECYITAREKASKMIGCIKQQFTKRFKAWYNEIHVRERKFRIRPIPRGSLWDARAEIEFIANETELMSCVLYIETNYLKIRAATEIRTLKTPPVQTQKAPESADLTCPYRLLHRYLLAHGFQSGGWYARGQKGHTTALSDGTDGRWLTGRQLEYWWNKPVKSYPVGWRKVWFKKGGGILIVTPDNKRRYHKNPVLDLLGKTPGECGRTFRHLVLAACWHNRTRVWSDNAARSQPFGADEL